MMSPRPTATTAEAGINAVAAAAGVGIEVAGEEAVVGKGVTMVPLVEGEGLRRLREYGAHAHAAECTPRQRADGTEERG